MSSSTQSFRGGSCKGVVGAEKTGWVKSGIENGATEDGPTESDWKDNDWDKSGTAKEGVIISLQQILECSQNS